MGEGCGIQLYLNLILSLFSTVFIYWSPTSKEMIQGDSFQWEENCF